ncbi:MAG: hypothetical protein GY830_03365 [Bacteroidetes bacterium]|nr:hypothetical protein [Bacteroidota bacterium]
MKNRFLKITTIGLLLNCMSNLKVKKHMQLYVINQSDYKYQIITSEYQKIKTKYKIDLNYPLNFIFKKCESGQILTITLPKEYIKDLIIFHFKNSNIEKINILNTKEFEELITFTLDSIDGLKNSSSLLNTTFYEKNKDTIKKHNLIMAPSEILLGNDLFYSLSQIENNCIDSLKDKKLNSLIKIKLHPKNYSYIKLIKKSTRLKIDPEKDQCPFCLCNYKDKIIINHKCKNYFCYSCLQNHFEKGYDTLCPFCKQDLFII